MKQYEAVPKNFLMRKNPVIIRHALYLFLDDIRDAPIHYIEQGFQYFCKPKSVNEAKRYVTEAINTGINEIWFDLDHDLGDYASQGGDAIELVNWLVEEFHDKNVDFKFHFHSMNPVGVLNMKSAVEKYWEVYNGSFYL